jgi:hypothetical protein
MRVAEFSELLFEVDIPAREDGNIDRVFSWIFPFNLLSFWQLFH